MNCHEKTVTPAKGQELYEVPGNRDIKENVALPCPQGDPRDRNANTSSQYMKSECLSQVGTASGATRKLVLKKKEEWAYWKRELRHSKQNGSTGQKPDGVKNHGYVAGYIQRRSRMGQDTKSISLATEKTSYSLNQVKQGRRIIRRQEYFVELKDKRFE
jgi:hypothetical protein